MRMPWRRRAVRPADPCASRGGRPRGRRAARRCPGRPAGRILGVDLERMFSWICLPVSFSGSARMRSASAPRRPMTMPGRAVWMSTRTRSRALDLDAAHAGAVQLRLQELADLDVLGHVVGVTLAQLRGVGEPTRHVVRGDAGGEPYGLTFCPITCSPSCSWSRPRPHRPRGSRARR